MRRFIASLLVLLAAVSASAQSVRTTLPTSDSARAVALNAVTNKAYVINEYANTVSVIDGATGTISATIALGTGTRPQYIAVNPQTNRIYVSQGDASLSIIDGTTNTPVSYPIGSTGPIAINPVTGVVFVVRLSTAATDEVTLVNDSGSSVTWQSIATNSYQPMDISVDPLTNFYYVIHYPAGHIRQVDGNSTSDFPPSTQVDVGKPGILVAMNQVSRRVYTVTGSSVSPLGVIDASNLAFTPISATVANPAAVAVNPVTNKVYVAFDGQVVVIDGATNALTYIPSGVSGSGPVSIGVNVVTNKIYVPNANGTMTIINGDTNATTTLAIPSGATYVAVNPVTNTAYVTSPSGVTLVDGAATDTAHAIPLTTAISQTTTGASPTFQFNATSTYAPGRFPIQRVYYQVDSLTGAWQLATGSGPFSGSASALAAGHHVIYAFAADGQDVPLTGLVSSPVIGAISSLAFDVGTAPPPVNPSVALTASPNPATQGQSVTLTANVSGTAGTATGSITFRDGTSVVAGCSTTALLNGTATCVTSSIAAGTHSITAQYSGDASYNAATSSAVSLAVNTATRATPTATLSASPASPATAGQSVTFTVSVTGASGTPTGIVVFHDGGTTIGGCGNVVLSGGTASCTTSALAAGTHSISGDYSGDSAYNPASSNTVNYTVNPQPKVAPTIALATSGTPARPGTAVTFTASVSGSAGTATGTVDFLDGTSALCTAVALASGTATCTTSTLAAGDHSITASYGGDASYLAATSNTLVQRIASTRSKRGVDYNGDGKADLTWRNDNTGASGVWLMNGTSATSFSGVSAGPGYVIVLTGDFDGDGKTDLIYRGTDGSYALQLMDGTSVKAQNTILNGGTGWELVGKGDFNGDGKTDLLWKNVNGTYGLWLMNGTTFSSAGLFQAPGPGWDAVIVADFDGDGRSDILWQNVDGRVQMWLMNGFLSTAQADMVSVANGWTPTHAADLNGDGKADLVWKHTSGSIGLWLVNGTTITSYSVPLGGGSGWSVKLVADLNGDGKDDILLTHTDGSVGAWLMNGQQIANSAVILGAGSGWSPVSSGDFNGDGKGDLIWRYTDGTYGMWLMNGLAASQYGVLFPSGTGWDVIP